MADREKVIDGIRKCLSHKPCSENGCPYEDECAVEHLNDPLLRDALSLLKEQEAIEPDVDSEGTCICGNCGENVGYYPPGSKVPEKLCKYCPECGQAVKWE